MTTKTSIHVDGSLLGWNVSLEQTAAPPPLPPPISPGAVTKVWFSVCGSTGSKFKLVETKVEDFNSARVRPRNGFPFINNFPVAQSAKLWLVIR